MVNPWVWGKLHKLIAALSFSEIPSSTLLLTMLKKIIVVLLVLLGGLLAVIVNRPESYRVARSTTIAAPAADVFALVNDFHNWDDWSPWAKLDPAMKKTYDGASTGVGAGYYWIGDDKVGEGRMTITESQPNEKVGIKLEFLKPFAAVNATDFTIKPEGNGVTVNWTMTGHNDLMGKAASLFMDMEKMIGGDFEKGLAQMKARAESKPKL